MAQTNSRIIQFPGTQQKLRREASHKITNVDGIKYFSQQQIKLLRRTVRDQATLDYYRRREIRPEWAVRKPSTPAARSRPAIFFSVFTLLASS